MSQSIERGEREEISFLLDEAFRVENYVDDFPQVFTPGLNGTMVSLRREGRLAAFCALSPVRWQIPGGALILAGCLGSVATATEFRGKGLGLCVVKEAISLASRQGADFVFLFSDLVDFYERAGFRRGGREYFARLDARERTSFPWEEKLARVGFAKGREFHWTDEPSALPLTEQAEAWDFICTKASPAENTLGFLEFRRLLSIPRMGMARLRRNGILTALAFTGKGHDFTDVVHSVAFEDERECLGLIARIRERFPTVHWLFMPGPWFREFQKLGIECTQSTHALLYHEPFPHSALSTSELTSWLDRGRLYVRGLQSS